MRGLGTVLRPPADGDASSRGVISWLFLRALALVHAFAFLSLARELDGLLGPDGLLPAASFLKRARAYLGPSAYWRLPSVFWLGAGGPALHAGALAGVLLAALLLFGVWPRPVLVLLWALYLSFTSVGQVFYGYQWDSLLVETSLLAILLAPGGFRPGAGRGSEPAPVAAFLLRFLLFRLMLSSGLVKLLSGDPTWRGLTALTFHYETQPLPTWISWWAHQLPVPLQALSCALMFVLEVAVPFLLFGPRRVRLAAAAALASFQALIAATGNYTFFNLLSAALCLTAIDDASLPRALRERLARPAGPRGRRALPAWLLGPLALALLFAASVRLLVTARIPVPWPRPVAVFVTAAEPFGVASPYGLFAVMTTSRPEIELQGSLDGATWHPYAFRWKPGDVLRAPGFVAPFQPRLDWQMWFAAFQTCEENPWLQRLLEAMLENREAPLGLLGENPFPDAPPRFVRAVLFDYRFTDVATRRRTGAWWRRELRGLYCPTLAGR